MKTLYKNISIEGNIGAGKSTLAKFLAERMKAEFVAEQFDDNPFLENFYSDPERYSFAVELSFLEQRFRQQKEISNKTKIFVSDFFWEKSLVFARVNLKGEELHLYERIYRMMASQMSTPDLVVYLHRPIEKLLYQINRRGRHFEKKIEAEYLMKVAAGYRFFFSAEKRMPILWIDNDSGPDALCDRVFKLMQKQFINGLHLNP